MTTAMTPILWSLSYSPWSERARWALERCGVAHRRRAYRPLIDEPALRRTLGRWRGVVTVPILETAEGVLDDSFAIAAYAAGRAPGEGLMPERDRSKISAYDALANRGLAAGRVASLGRVLEDRASLRDLVPGGMRRLLGPVGPIVAGAGVRRTLRKYAAVSPRAPRETLVEVLDTLRADLAKGEPDERGVAHLLDGFTYADVTAAQVLAFVEPPRTHLRMTDATRATYRDAELAERYADLVTWRDALYAAYREPREGRPAERR